jgi:hypothetical protein
MTIQELIERMTHKRGGVLIPHTLILVDDKMVIVTVDDDKFIHFNIVGKKYLKSIGML